MLNKFDVVRHDPDLGWAKEFLIILIYVFLTVLYGSHVVETSRNLFNTKPVSMQLQNKKKEVIMKKSAKSQPKIKKVNHLQNQPSHPESL